MKITEAKLRKIIKEEVKNQKVMENFNLINESAPTKLPGWLTFLIDDIGDFFNYWGSITTSLGFVAAALLGFVAPAAWFIVLGCWLVWTKAMVITTGFTGRARSWGSAINDALADIRRNQDISKIKKLKNLSVVGAKLATAMAKTSGMSAGQKRFAKSIQNKVEQGIKNGNPTQIYAALTELGNYLKKNGLMDDGDREDLRTY